MNFRKFNLEKIFYLIFSLAIISRVVCDLLLNRMGVQNGDVYPIRHIFPDIPVYSVSLFYLEIILILIGALLINTKKVRTGCLFIIAGYLMGMSQMFQNQKLLILIMASTLLILPVSKEDRSSIWFLRYQLILVYSISAMQKIFSNFYLGHDLLMTTRYLITIEHNFFIKGLLLFISNPVPAKLFSVSTIALEFAIPFFLIKKPKIGIALVIWLHFSMNLLMKDIMPFTFTMLALSLLFLPDFNLDK